MDLPIQEFRQITESYMPDTLIVRERQIIGRNPDGGDPIYSDPVVVVNTVCRIRSQNGDEQVIAGRLQATSTATIVYPWDVNLKENQTVEVSGNTYNIVYVERGSQALRAHGKALVARA